MNTKHKLLTLKTMTWYERWLLSVIWLALLATDISLRIYPGIHVPSKGKMSAKKQQTDIEINAEIKRLARLVDIAARHHLYPITCLRRSLVLQWFLKQRGINTTLKIGVRKDGESIGAHAWLEYNDAIIAETQNPRDSFQVFQNIGNGA